MYHYFKTLNCFWFVCMCMCVFVCVCGFARPMILFSAFPTLSERPTIMLSRLHIVKPPVEITPFYRRGAPGSCYVRIKLRHPHGYGGFSLANVYETVLNHHLVI